MYSTALFSALLPVSSPLTVTATINHSITCFWGGESLFKLLATWLCCSRKCCILVAAGASADADDLVLLTANFTVSADTASHEFSVELGLLSVEAAFDQLAWAGMYYPRPRHSTSTIVIHAQIVGAQVSNHSNRQDVTDEGTKRGAHNYCSHSVSRLTCACRAVQECLSVGRG